MTTVKSRGFWTLLVLWGNHWFSSITLHTLRRPFLGAWRLCSYIISIDLHVKYFLTLVLYFNPGFALVFHYSITWMILQTQSTGLIRGLPCDCCWSFLQEDTRFPGISGNVSKQRYTVSRLSCNTSLCHQFRGPLSILIESLECEC